MLPSFKLDGKTDYVLADDSIISEYGIREASVVYDDIYPSITGMLNYDDEPIDEIKSVDEVDDSKDTFVVYLYDLGFDLESNLTTENAQISMKSGSLIGYTFNISEIEKLEDNSYKITLGRITNEEGDTGNFNIPNSQWSIAAGDKAVCWQQGKFFRRIEGAKQLHDRFLNNGVRFRLNVDAEVLRKCIAAGNNNPYWLEYWQWGLTKQDLRNPKYRRELANIKKQFGL
jgi:hypothetical protein